MSKSLGNVFNVKDLIDQGHRPSTLRYLLLSVHYRKQLKFSMATLAQCDEALKRLMDFLARLDTVTAAGAHPAVAERVAAARAEFDAHLLNDVNAPGGLGVLFDLVRGLNAAIDAGEVGTADVAVIREAFDHFDLVLGFIGMRRAEDAAPPVDVAEIERLIVERREARQRARVRRAPTRSARIWRRGVSCSRIRRRARAGSAGEARPRAAAGRGPQSGAPYVAAEDRDRAARPQRARRSSPATPRRCRRPTRAAIRW